MKTVEKKELLTVKGGVTLSGTVLEQFNILMELLLEAGRQVGSSIRRIGSKSICPIE